MAVANTGSAPVDGWSLALTLSSGAVTARGLTHNASISPGGSQTFGFQGTYSGAFAAPGSFSLNGTACARA